MKYTYFIFLITLFVGIEISAQDKKPLSPPQTLEASVGDVSLTIEYNAPSKRDRDIWGGLIPYGKLWRTGANEATRIVVDSDVLLEGNLLKKGTYSLFTIPGEMSCTIVINEVAKQWGSFSYDESKDVMRFEVTPYDIEKSEEMMKFDFTDDKVILIWDQKAIPFSVSKA